MIKFFAGTLLLVITIGFVSTALLTFGKNQELFLQGFHRESMLQGEYLGTVHGLRTSWVGKKIISAQAGINMFRNSDGSLSEKYPFTMSIGRGSHDYETSVLRIDYNNSQNPFWVRPILDELSEVAPGTFLGKLEYRLIPYFPFTLTYFTLSLGESK